jgi:1,6-anhydro-N-acetylmuramate kinase
MDTDEQELQREGFAEACRSPLVHNAIRNGMLGRIAVTYMEWAGSAHQKVIIPWTVLDNSESLMAFADRIASTPLRRAQRTSVSGAIDAATNLFELNGLEATRKVIDVSGDGVNNQGRPVVQARDEAVARGITINGLPIMLKQVGYMGNPDLDLYFRDCVIGGQGAFMVPAREKSQFQQAIKAKILLEVSGLLPTEVPLIRPIQGDATRRANCLAGEIRWQNRSGN